MLNALTEKAKSDAGYLRNALPDRRHSGVHSLVCSVSAELSPGGNNAGVRRVGRPFLDRSLAIRFLPLLEKTFRKHNHQVGGSRRMNETCNKVKGVWKYLYRAVDKHTKTVDFLLTVRHDKPADMWFFEKAMQ
jgi:hypothetical protein